MSRGYRKLKVWKNSVAMTTELYGRTSQFPVRERWGLAFQIRESAASMATNMAKGWGQQSVGESMHFWSWAWDSLRELETHLTVACNLRLLKSHEFAALIESLEEIEKTLNRVIAVLRIQPDGPGPCAPRAGSPPAAGLASHSTAGRRRPARFSKALK